MREHIRILGILNIIMGGLGALVGCIILLVMGGIATFISSAVQSGNADVGDAAVAAPIVATIGVGIAIFFFVLSLPSIIGGWGLLNYKSWSRILMIVISVLNLFHIPLGTALGVYGLWVLFSEDARRILETGGAYQAVPAPVYPTYSRPS
ncbi:MAG TPA: hypothetical protein VLI55_17585 [Bryobacteraceae bacterium]|jgi:hypothetical protein|nr:hypothetical protein [Bryobacteraceae bacterium]